MESYKYSLKMHSNGAFLDYQNLQNDFGNIESLRSLLNTTFFLNDGTVNPLYNLTSNEKEIYSSSQTCKLEFLERLLYLSNQTEKYNAVSLITFVLDPHEQQITYVQAISKFQPVKLEDAWHAVLLIFAVWFLLIRPISGAIDESTKLCD